MMSLLPPAVIIGNTIASGSQTNSMTTGLSVTASPFSIVDRTSLGVLALSPTQPRASARRTMSGFVAESSVAAKRLS